MPSTACLAREWLGAASTGQEVALIVDAVSQPKRASRVSRSSEIIRLHEQEGQRPSEDAGALRRGALRLAVGGSVESAVGGAAEAERREKAGAPGAVAAPTLGDFAVNRSGARADGVPTQRSSMDANCDDERLHRTIGYRSP